MSDAGEAVEGIVALVAGGFVLLLIGSSVDSGSVLYDISLVGMLMVLLAIVLAVALVAGLLGQLLSGLGGV